MVLQSHMHLLDSSIQPGAAGSKTSELQPRLGSKSLSLILNRVHGHACSVGEHTNSAIEAGMAVSKLTSQLLCRPSEYYHTITTQSKTSAHMYLDEAQVRC